MEQGLSEVSKFSHLSGWGVEQDRDHFLVTIGAENIGEEIPIKFADYVLKPCSGEILLGY